MSTSWSALLLSFIILSLVMLVTGIAFYIYRYRKWAAKGGTYMDFWRAYNWGLWTRKYGNPWTNEPAPDRRRRETSAGWYRMRDERGEWANGEDVERGYGMGRSERGGN
ncbi:MAG: hypothetical protein ALECFALPRED_001737 [Alectoria fallacina]|uniref:Uncharacterized protein n=1 Tax=Alectoria fallacina TaxID=1903189 RepID=A0A8H3FCR6_9LECA|nr:MAG: hypothetical protein ALECFALPRED_001737 [Alectoria fallacina]